MNFRISLFLLLVFSFILSTGVVAQENTINEQIKNERDAQLKDLNDKLKTNEELISKLTEKLAATDSKTATDKEKIKDLETLQLALDDRLRILEETPKTKINLNGQLAFTELLSIQRDIQPVDLFLTSQTFFTQLGNIGKIQQYNGFTTWKSEYDKWYKKQGQEDPLVNVLNTSISLISSATAAVPLYGTMVNTAISGVSNIMMTMGKKEKELYDRTPQMLLLLNVTSQFEQQKSIIDHEWTLINKELEQLQKENTELLQEQMAYYGISMDRYQSRYLKATLDSDREGFKNECRKIISEKLSGIDKNPASKGKWLGQVETYMYKVQSLRLRFGQLTMRMMANIEQYQNLITMYSDATKFPAEFTSKINNLNNPLNSLKNKFNSSFNPARYIEDSAVMYIERN
jgi:chromosome segregation ATPase